MRPLFTLSLLASMFFLCCKKKSSTSNLPGPTSDCGTIVPHTVLSVPADTTGPTIVLDSFPLVTGHQWTYKLKEQAYDACGQMYFDSLVYTLTAVSDTVIHGIRFALVSTSYYNAGTGWFHFPSTFFCYPLQSYYFVNFSNGLHELDGLGNTDSSYIADNTGYLIATSSTAYSWNSPEHTFANDTMVQRTKAGYVTVTTPAGTFNCLKINVSDTNNNYTNSGFFGPSPGGSNSSSFSTSQYFSAKGLVLEIQTGDGSEAGPGHGPTIVTRVITLTAVNF